MVCPSCTPLVTHNILVFQPLWDTAFCMYFHLSIKTNNSRDQKPHITVPYHQGLSESFKRTCKKYGIEVHLKGGPTIKNLLMAPKIKIQFLRKGESYTDSNATGWSVVKNTLGSQQEILERGLRNI